MAISSFLRRKRQPIAVPGSPSPVGALSTAGLKTVNDRSQQALDASKTELAASAPAAQANLAGQIAGAEARIPSRTRSILRPQTAPQAVNDPSPLKFSRRLQTSAETDELFPVTRSAQNKADSAFRVKSSRRSFMSPRERKFADQQEAQTRSDRLSQERRAAERGIVDRKQGFLTSEREATQANEAAQQKLANEQQRGILSQQGTQAVNLQEQKNVGLIGAAQASRAPDEFQTDVLTDVTGTGKNKVSTDRIVRTNTRTGQEVGQQSEASDPVASAQKIFDDNIQGGGLKKAFTFGKYQGDDAIANRKVKTAISSALETVFRDVQPQTIEDVKALMEEGMGIDEAIENIAARARAQQQ